MADQEKLYGTAAKLRARQAARLEGSKNFGTKFLFKGYNMIDLTGEKGEKVHAVLVSQQEKDKGYIYTTLDNPLKIGSVWESKLNHWMVDDEIEIVKNVNWHKYSCLRCNTNLEGIWGYFIGPEASYVNITLNQNAILTSQQKPMLVMPAGVLEFREKIVIQGRPWMIQEKDDISKPGIVYFSLAPTTVGKDTVEEAGDASIYAEAVSDKVAIDSNNNDKELSSQKVLHADTEYGFDTTQGYLKYSPSSIEILSHTATEVVLKVPFGIDEIYIETAPHGVVLKERYKVIL